MEIISKSGNLMLFTTRNIFDYDNVVLEYGCGAHYLSTVFEGNLKPFTVQSIVNSTLYASKCIKHQKLLNKIFEVIIGSETLKK